MGIRDKLTMMTRVVNCWPRESYSAASSVIFLSLLSSMVMWCDGAPTAWLLKENIDDDSRILQNPLLHLVTSGDSRRFLDVVGLSE